MKDLPDDLQNQDRKSTSKANHLYRIRNSYNGAEWFHTNNLKDISVAGASATLGADPRTFTAGQISHSAIEHSSKYSESGVVLKAISDDEQFARWIQTASGGNISLTIWRFASDPDVTSLDYDDDVLPVFFGEMSDISYVGYVYNATFISPFYQMQQPVPRFYFQRMCNHVLFGEGCGLNKEDFEESVTVSAYDRIQRTVMVNAAQSGDYYGGGYIIEDSTGTQIGIASSTGGVLKLNSWIPELEGTPDLTLYPGCDHTTGHCGAGKFNNLSNFGGFPYIPLKNPSADGVT
jgi:hypothetical protein